MKKLLLTLLCPLLLAASDTLTVAFWNVENLFDLEDDPNNHSPSALMHQRSNFPYKLEKWIC